MPVRRNSQSEVGTSAWLTLALKGISGAIMEPMSLSDAQSMPMESSPFGAAPNID